MDLLIDKNNKLTDEEFSDKIVDFTDESSFERCQNYNNFLRKDVIEKMF